MSECMTATCRREKKTQMRNTLYVLSTCEINSKKMESLFFFYFFAKNLRAHDERNWEKNILVRA